MAKKKDQPALLPADIVQVTDKRGPYYMALLVVQDVRPRFIACGFPVYDEHAMISLEYVRLQHDQCEKVGTAALVAPDIGRARKLAVETAQLLAKEAQR